MNIDPLVELKVRESDYYGVFEHSTDLISSSEAKIQYFLNDQGVYITHVEDETATNDYPFLCSPLFILNASKYMRSGKLVLTIAYKFKTNWFCMNLDFSDTSKDICFKLNEVGVRINPTQENKIALVHYLSVLLSQMDEVDYIQEQKSFLNSSLIFNLLGRKLFRLKDRLQKWMNVIKEEGKRGE